MEISWKLFGNSFCKMIEKNCPPNPFGGNFYLKMEKMGLSNKVCKFQFTHDILTPYLLAHHEGEVGS